MEASVGPNQIDHPASRWLSAFAAVATAAFGAAAVWGALSWEVTWISVPIALLVAFGLAVSSFHFTTLVIDPTAFSVGDEGIVCRAFARRGHANWTAFIHFVQHNGEEGDFVTLRFRGDKARKPIVLTLAGYPGLNRELLIQDARKRLLAKGIQPVWAE